MRFSRPRLDQIPRFLFPSGSAPQKCFYSKPQIEQIIQTVHGEMESDKKVAPVAPGDRTEIERMTTAGLWKMWRAA